MRIAIVGHAFAGGGAEFVSRTWASELARRDNEVHFLTTDKKSVGQGPVGVAHQPLHEGRWSHLSKVLNLARFIRNNPGTVFVALQTYPALTLILARMLSPKAKAVCIISERNIPSILLRREGASQRIQLRLAKLLYRRADAAVAISHPVAADLISSFNVEPNRCFVVPNPAVAKVSTQAPTTKNSPPDCLTLVLPFRLVDQKNPLLAAEVAGELLRRGVPTRLLSFGVGPLKESLETHAGRLDVPIQFHGWDEQWFESLPTGSVVLLPSHCEGFGNVLVEAASRGVASVAWSGALGVADAIVPGVTGEFSISSSATHFADAVIRARGIGTVDGTKWLHRFSIEASVDALNDVISTVVQASPDMSGPTSYRP